MKKIPHSQRPPLFTQPVNVMLFVIFPFHGLDVACVTGVSNIAFRMQSGRILSVSVFFVFSKIIFPQHSKVMIMKRSGSGHNTQVGFVGVIRSKDHSSEKYCWPSLNQKTELFRSSAMNWSNFRRKILFIRTRERQGLVQSSKNTE